MSDKPREFWIWNEYDKKTWDFKAQAQKPVHEDACFHVIEYSEVERLREQLEKAILERDDSHALKLRLISVKEENERLKAEIANLKEELFHRKVSTRMTGD